MSKTKNRFKKIAWILFLVIVLINVIACFHAYKFTHFISTNIEKTKNPDKLSVLDKIKTIILGVNNPRPRNNNLPKHAFTTIRLKSNKEIECWSMKADHSKGTVIIFHGFSGQKSSMLDKSEEFLKLGYSTLLVDFMGSGGSEGNQTTVGFFEAMQVNTCFNYVKARGEKTIYLFGTSMGAVAVMKAIHDDPSLSPKAILIECPFGNMYHTVSARFKSMHVPIFPMAGLLVFWGGVQNKFWAFSHNPVEYAKKINCPTLLMYGCKDETVSKEETEELFYNLHGKKELVIYPNAGHDNFLIGYKEKWKEDIKNFIEKY